MKIFSHVSPLGHVLILAGVGFAAAGAVTNTVWFVFPTLGCAAATQIWGRRKSVPEQQISSPDQRFLATVDALTRRDQVRFNAELNGFGAGAWGSTHQAALRAAGVAASRSVDAFGEATEDRLRLRQSLISSLDWLEGSVPQLAAQELDRAGLLAAALAAGPDTWSTRPSPHDLAALIGIFAACCSAGVENLVVLGLPEPAARSTFETLFMAAFAATARPGPAAGQSPEI